MTKTRRWRCFLAAWVALAACDTAPAEIVLPPLSLPDAAPRPFSCRDPDSVECINGVHYSCRPNGEFLQEQTVDCTEMGKICDLQRTCITCSPKSYRCKPCEAGARDCNPHTVQQCDDSGDSYADLETCDLEAGDACSDGACTNMCKLAEENRSYVGCHFYAADLDNAAINDRNNASGQQFAVAVANPQPVPVEVTVSINDGQFGGEVEERTIDQVVVPPGALEVFELPRREVDGSSEHGLNDGTHSALTPNAFFVDSSHPITAYQFNPLENVNVFSNDASLLLPTSAIGSKYTVVAWPQTIGDSDNPEQDFDSTSSNEDLRAFLTIIGTQDGTEVQVLLGDEVKRVVGAPGIPQSGSGDVLPFEINRYDVINLETEGFNADFTGSLVMATKPVTVFVGSEASDVPKFGTYATRQCCADHLEEQLIPDSTLGSRYIVARMPPRTAALAAAAFEDDPLSIAVINEPEWIRVIAVADGTTIRTSLPPPNDEFELDQGQSEILRADQDFTIESSRPVSVLQALPSQGVTGIPREYPGGDPDLIVVPPIAQYRRDYVFLTPDKYAFDFVTIMADNGTSILLDGEPLPDHCTTSPADGNARRPGERPPEAVIHRCQLTFPKVPSGPNSRPLAGDQSNDGVHTLLADRPIGIIVYGFDRFVSYAYVGGLNLEIIN